MLDHHSSCDTHILQDNKGKSIFNCIETSNLKILKDPILLRKSSGSSSDRDISFGPANLLPSESGALSNALAPTIS